MSKLVCRMAKVKKNDVRGYQIHNLRELDSKTNPDIEKSLEHLNKDFVNAERINFMEKWKETFESQNTSKRALRKDAVFYNEFIIGSDKQFFDKLDQNEKDRFFKVATDFFKERYGEQNVLYSIAHYDETRGAGAHAHVAIVPMRDGKLQSKNVFDRNELRHLQDELPKTLQRAGFDIERGQEGSKAKHIETATYKMMNAQKLEQEATMDIGYAKQHVELLNEQIQDLSVAVDEIRDIESVEYDFKKNWLGKETDEVFLNREDFDQIKYYAEDRAKVVTDLQKKERENNFLMREITKLEQEKKQYAEKNHVLGLELHNHKTDIERMVKLQTKQVQEEIIAKANSIVEKSREANRKEIETMKRHVYEADERENHIYEVNDDLRKEIAAKNQVIETKNQEISKLKSELESVKESFRTFKKQVERQFEKVLTQTTKLVKDAVMKANQEWIKKNVDNHAGLLHLDSKKEIEQRSRQIEDELREKELSREQRSERDKGMEMER